MTMGALDRWLAPSPNVAPAISATSATSARDQTVQVAEVAKIAGPPNRTPAARWSDEDWREFFNERAAIAEFDGGLSRQEAEQRAIEACIAHWLNLHPADPTPENSCAVCGEALDHPGRYGVPVLRPGGGHHWLHEGCIREWWRMRRQRAITAVNQSVNAWVLR